jgi:hypothetical protein
MLRPFRSLRLAWITLLAFLFAQPVVGCALLCLDSHHGQREMAGMVGPSATGPVTCHTDIGPATHHGPARTLSPMEPAGEQPPMRLTIVSVQPLAARPPAFLRTTPSLDPPPPRLV